MKCWEFMRCGREAGGPNEAELGPCPAYPDHGHDCARVNGTVWAGEAQGSCATKQPCCMECGYFGTEHYDHGYKPQARLEKLQPSRKGT